MSVKIKVKMKLSEIMARARFVDHGVEEVDLSGGVEALGADESAAVQR